MARQIVRSSHWPDSATLRTDNADPLDLVAAHCHERRCFVGAERARTECINGDHGQRAGGRVMPELLAGIFHQVVELFLRQVQQACALGVELRKLAQLLSTNPRFRDEMVVYHP
jgi:hypothetical protein